MEANLPFGRVPSQYGKRTFETLKITQMIQDIDKSCGGFVWNGVTMRLLMELLRMERLYMLMGGDHGSENS